MYVNEVVARVIFLFKDVMTYEITFVPLVSSLR